MNDLTIPKRYFSENTMSHLRMHEGLSDRYILRSLDVTLAAKLTHVYGKYHLMMDYRKLAMSNYQMNYQQAERQAYIMNQLTFVHYNGGTVLLLYYSGYTHATILLRYLSALLDKF